jgi:hypothetical protein
MNRNSSILDLSSPVTPQLVSIPVVVRVVFLHVCFLLFLTYNHLRANKLHAQAGLHYSKLKYV